MAAFIVILSIFFGIIFIKDRVIELIKFKEYTKEMSVKEANEEIKSERTIRQKGTIFIFFFLVILSFIFMSQSKTEQKTKVETKVEEKKEVVEKKEKTEGKTADKKVEEEKDIYKEIEENLKNSFPRITRVSAAESGVVIEAKAQDGFNKKGIVKEVLKDAKKYAKKIDTLYTDNDLKYESITLQFFYPMTDGLKSENMKIIQLNYSDLGWEPVYILRPFQEAFEEVLK
jgi:hypothetical protein|nr:MAG TPA: hypothetical protein [Caudoviricetes sp.]